MATINPHTTRATGTVLTAAIYNTDHQNHITNVSNVNAEVVIDTGAIAGHETRIVTLEGGGFVLPKGVIWEYGGTVAPSGWLLCFGQAISRVTYAALFAVIGTAYGVGDGSTTFNIPDFRGRVGAGQDDMGGVSANRLTVAGGLDGDVLGGVGGAETVALSIANLAAHTHAGPSHTHTGTTDYAGDHAHSFTGFTGAGGTSAFASGSQQLAGPATTGVTGLHAHNFTTSAAGNGATSSTGTGTPISVVQPTLIVNKIIYTG